MPICLSVALNYKGPMKYKDKTKTKNFNDEHAHPQTNYLPIRRIVMDTDGVAFRRGRH